MLLYISYSIRQFYTKSIKSFQLDEYRNVEKNIDKITMFDHKEIRRKLNKLEQKKILGRKEKIQFGVSRLMQWW